MNRAYAREHAELDEGLEPFVRGDKRRPVAVVLVEDLDRKTMHALQYAKTIRSSTTHAVHVDRDPGKSERLRARGSRSGSTFHSASFRATATCQRRSRPMPHAHGRCGRDGDRSRPRTDRPSRASPSGPHRGSAREGAGSESARARDARTRSSRATPGGDGRAGVRMLPRTSHRVVVLVDRPDRAALAGGALRAVPRRRGGRGGARGGRSGGPGRADLALDGAPDADRARPGGVLGPRRREVGRAVRRRPHGTAHRGHRRASRGETSPGSPSGSSTTGRAASIARTLGRYEHVDVAVVPYFFGAKRARPSLEGSPADRAPAGSDQAR